MPTRHVWSNVAVALQSAIGADQVISAVTKANPGVATYVGADPSNGDYVLIKDVQGMYQLTDRIVRVANVDTGANTFELEGVDTTAFDTWVSGDFAPLTFGTTLAVATGVQASGGEFEFIDATTIHDTVRTRIPGVASPISLSFTCIWDPADVALAALKAASDLKAQRAVRVTFSDGAKFLFYGYVGATLLPTGGAQELVSTPVVIEGNGRPTAYTS